MNDILFPAADRTEFDTWWNTSGEWVEPANVRRNGESGVQRLMPDDPHQPVLYLKRQTGHLYRSVAHPFGRPTVLRELDAYRAWDRLGITLPKVVYGGARRQNGEWQAILVTEALTGFTDMGDWYASGAHQACAPAVRRVLLDELALALAKLHKAYWQHGCLYPKHIFVNAAENDPALALLDLEKCRRRFNRAAAVRNDLDQLYRHRGAMPDEDWRYLSTRAASLHALFL